MKSPFVAKEVRPKYIRRRARACLSQETNEDRDGCHRSGKKCTAVHSWMRHAIADVCLHGLSYVPPRRFAEVRGPGPVVAWVRPLQNISCAMLGVCALRRRSRPSPMDAAAAVVLAVLPPWHKPQYHVGDVGVRSPFALSQLQEVGAWLSAPNRSSVLALACDFATSKQAIGLCWRGSACCLGKTKQTECGPPNTIIRLSCGLLDRTEKISSTWPYKFQRLTSQVVSNALNEEVAQALLGASGCYLDSFGSAFRKAFPSATVVLSPEAQIVLNAWEHRRSACPSRLASSVPPSSPSLRAWWQSRHGDSHSQAGDVGRRLVPTLPAQEARAPPGTRRHHRKTLHR